MKKVILGLIMVLALSCSKDDNTNMTLTEIGLDYNISYKVQQQIIPSNNPADWKFVDMPDSVSVRFLNNEDAVEAHGSKPGVPVKIVLHTRAVRSKEFGLNLLGTNNPCVSNCPIVMAAAGGCTLLKTSAGVVLQKPSGSNFLDGYRFVKQ